MPPELRAIQRWMQGAVVAESPVGERAVARRIKPSRTLSPVERLDVYRDMYEARLNEALRSDYPGLVDILGDETFDELAHLYFQEHPSRSYTLNRLGDHLPDFISEVEGLRRERAVADLARLELALTYVFDEEETPSLDAAALAAVPQEAWKRARLRFIAAFRLLALDYPVHHYLEALREGRPRPRLRAKKTFLAVYRRSFALGTIELDAASHALLTDLARGTRLGKAVSRIPSRRARALSGWFAEWAGAGLFREIVH